MLVCVCFVHFAHETAGAARTRSSLRPLTFWEGQRNAKLGRNTPRECGLASSTTVMPRVGGASSTPRPLGSSTVSGILDHPLSRVTTIQGRLFDIEIRKRRLRPQRLHPDRRLLVFCVRLPCAACSRMLCFSSSRWPLVVSRGTSGALPGPL